MCAGYKYACRGGVPVNACAVQLPGSIFAPPVLFYLSPMHRNYYSILLCSTLLSTAAALRRPLEPVMDHGLASGHDMPPHVESEYLGQLFNEDGSPSEANILDYIGYRLAMHDDSSAADYHAESDGL